MEQWKDIIGYEEFYQISNYGRVRSKDRRVRNHQKGSTRVVHGMILNPWDNGNGYLVITLQKNRTRKNRYIHSLVAEHFIDNPLGNRYVNHLDFDTHNNNASNLQWCTQRENVCYSREHMKKPKSMYRKSNTGEKYITSRCKHGKNYYRVKIRSLGVDKSFKTLSEAISYRNEVMQDGTINHSS